MRKKAFLAACGAALLLSACGGGNYKDGSYTARFKEADDHGWTEYLTVTVRDGKIVQAEFDADGENGMKKSEDEDYKDAYTGAGYDTYPADYSRRLEEALVSTQDENKVDTIAGATTSSNYFRTLMRSLEKAIRKGDTKEVIVNRPGD